MVAIAESDIFPPYIRNGLISRHDTFLFIISCNKIAYTVPLHCKLAILGIIIGITHTLNLHSNAQTSSFIRDIKNIDILSTLGRCLLPLGNWPMVCPYCFCILYRTYEIDRYSFSPLFFLFFQVLNWCLKSPLVHGSVYVHSLRQTTLKIHWSSFDERWKYYAQISEI